MADMRKKKAQIVQGELETIEKLFHDTIRSVVDIPFSQGTLAVNSPEPDAFSERDVSLMHEMALTLTEGFMRMDDLINLEKYASELEKEIADRKKIDWVSSRRQNGFVRKWRKTMALQSISEAILRQRTLMTTVKGFFIARYGSF